MPPNNGIFNPYKKPTDKKPTWNAEKQIHGVDAEQFDIKPSVCLDGHSFALEFQNLTLEQAPEQLGKLISDVLQNSDHVKTLTQHGIQMTKDPPQTNELLTLKTSSGYLSVYVDVEKNETEVFRRVAHALSKLRIKPILKKHNARIIVR